jgi:hypothetical protein
MDPKRENKLDLPKQLKHPLECILEFRSNDRFLFRAADLFELSNIASAELSERLRSCQIYIICRRPLISIIPGSIFQLKDSIRFVVKYRIQGIERTVETEIPRGTFYESELSFRVAKHPHRHIESLDATGNVVAETHVANRAHVLPGLPSEAVDVEALYIGKGMGGSTKRLQKHSTMQRILADANSAGGEMEIFCLTYSFEFRKNAAALAGQDTPRNELDRRLRQIGALKISRADQVSLIEAAMIGYFGTSDYNSHYLKFPDGKHDVLARIAEADVCALLIQVDTTNIGNLRIYSKQAPPASTHYVLYDFRQMRGEVSVLAALGIEGHVVQ